MNDADRAKVAEAVGQNYEWFHDLIKTSAANGHTAFAELWSVKTRPRAALTRRWHTENKPNLQSALGIRPLEQSLED